MPDSVLEQRTLDFAHAKRGASEIEGMRKTLRIKHQELDELKEALHESVEWIEVREAKKGIDALEQAIAEGSHELVTGLANAAK